MFKTIARAGLVLAALLPTVAAAEVATELDADGDGVVSMSEFNAALPEAGAALFAEIDTDADGVLSADEMAEAEENGMLPAAATDG